jgi:hypothetical protein
MSCATCSSTGARYIGTRPRIELSFVDTSDPPVPADPTTITVYVLYPDGTTASWTTPDATITNPDTVVGEWLFTFPAALMLAGEYWVFGRGDGGGADGTDEVSFTLHDTHVPIP